MESSPSPTPVTNRLAPFNPTSDDAIQLALQLAGLTSSTTNSEVFLDIGCGDGRVVLAAARCMVERLSSSPSSSSTTTTTTTTTSSTMRCIGIEMLPEFVERARQRLALEEDPRVRDIVEFIHGDATTAHLLISSSSSVVQKRDGGEEDEAEAVIGQGGGGGYHTTQQQQDDESTSPLRGGLGVVGNVSSFTHHGESFPTSDTPTTTPSTSMNGAAVSSSLSSSAAGNTVDSIPLLQFATCIFVYLVPAGLAVVADALEHVLRTRKGTRVVSNMFSIKGWAEKGLLREKRVTSAGLSVYLYQAS